MASDVLRLVRTVPSGAANLAYLQLPPMVPEAVTSVVPTAYTFPGNDDRTWDLRLDDTVSGTYYADNVGGVSGNHLRFAYNATPASTGGAISTGLTQYTMYLPGDDTVEPSGFVLRRYSRAIRVYPPVGGPRDAWYVEVGDGVVARTITLAQYDQSWLSSVFSSGDTLVVYYTVPEMQRIPSHLEDGATALDNRLVSVSGVYGVVENLHTIRLPHQNLYRMLSLTIDGVEQISSEAGRISGSTVFPAGPFSGWSPEHGLLRLTSSLSPESHVQATYLYRENRYRFRGYIDGSTYRNLDLNPTTGHYYDVTSPSSELIDSPVYLYLLPTAAYRTVTASGGIEQEIRLYSGLRWTNSFLRWERVNPASIAIETSSGGTCRPRSTYGHVYCGHAYFVSSVPSDGILAVPSGGQATGLAAYPSALLLAKLYTSPGGLESCRVIDCRVQGGGVPSEVSVDDPALPATTRQHLQTYWDEGGWDGEPAPLAGVQIFEVPADILTGSNGYRQFSQQEIEDIIRQHVAAGIRPFVEYV